MGLDMHIFFISPDGREEFAYWRSARSFNQFMIEMLRVNPDSKDAYNAEHYRWDDNALSCYDEEGQIFMSVMSVPVLEHIIKKLEELYNEDGFFNTPYLVEEDGFTKGTGFVAIEEYLGVLRNVLEQMRDRRESNGCIYYSDW